MYSGPLIVSIPPKCSIVCFKFLTYAFDVVGNNRVWLDHTNQQNPGTCVTGMGWAGVMNAQPAPAPAATRGTNPYRFTNPWHSLVPAMWNNGPHFKLINPVFNLIQVLYYFNQLFMPCYMLHNLFIWQVVHHTLNRKLRVHFGWLRHFFQDFGSKTRPFRACYMLHLLHLFSSLGPVTHYMNNQLK